MKSGLSKRGFELLRIGAPAGVMGAEISPVYSYPERSPAICNTLPACSVKCFPLFRAIGLPGWSARTFRMMTTRASTPERRSSRCRSARWLWPAARETCKGLRAGSPRLRPPRRRRMWTRRPASPVPSTEVGRIVRGAHPRVKPSVQHTCGRVRGRAGDGDTGDREAGRALIG